MDYYESAEGHYLTESGALSVLRQHGMDETAEGYQEWRAGQPALIPAQALLDWLGY
jgi:hypothetical protein